MLETRATVIKLEGQHAMVESDNVSSCKQCQGKGCGSSKLGQLFCASPRLFKVENSIQAKVGDEVVVAIGEGIVLRGIALAYLLPLLLLLVGAALGSALAVSRAAGQDGYAVAGALIGLMIGLVAARKIYLRFAKGYFQPYLTGLYRGNL
ncbi:MAG: SoxR reducing system RseC family protein [Gallionella sp.]|nr:SoxR reducing system RseC family protein [Gallionella sp.]